MGVAKIAGKLVAPFARNHAPALTASFVRQAFDRAVDGFGPLPGAAEAADKRLAEEGGNVDKAVKSLIEGHAKLAGMEGFATNMGGLVTMAMMLPVNISGLALLQCHLIAGIAHLRGYDIADPRVRNAVLACMLGEDTVKSLVRARKLPSSPMAIATAPALDPELDQRLASEVTAELITRVAGKRTVAMVGRRTPIIGGGIGAATDAYATYQVGKYAAQELRSRRS
ncbi:MAG TPA: EcsC family protein [Nocardioidaceae bacterium]|nr:EcsC family protein [Nocardioidaceae bacterium]